MISLSEALILPLSAGYAPVHRIISTFQLLYTGSVRSMEQLEDQIARIDHNVLREAVFNHVYDRDTANVGVGKCFMTFLAPKIFHYSDEDLTFFMYA